METGFRVFVFGVSVSFRKNPDSYCIDYIEHKKVHVVMNWWGEVTFKIYW